jgi:hypothetical protein
MKSPLLVCILCACAVSAFCLDREAFTITRYDLDARVEPELQRLAVRGRLELRNDSSSAQKHAVLQISSSLSWRSIESGGKPLQFVSQPFESDADHTGELSEAIVTLPKEVAPAGSVALDVGYEGVIVLDATRLTRIGVPKEVALHSDWDQIGKSFTAVRGAGYVAWYPVAMEAGNLSEGNSLFDAIGRWKQRERGAEIHIWLHETGDSAERPELPICNGAGAENHEGGSGVGAVDCSFSPVGLAVPTFVTGKYQLLDRPSLQVHYLPEHAKQAENFALAADKVTAFVTDWFRIPYTKAEVVELADPGASPFESGPWLLTPLSDTDPNLLQLALVHSFVHAAFPSQRPWIYEGLAHFAQAMYREKQDGRQAALDLMGLHRAAILEAEKQGGDRPKDSAAPSESLVATTREEFYRSKAAYVWWMLRDMVGDEGLKKALAEYNPQADKEPSYMQRLVQAQSKRDLEWFFDDWVYRDRGLPDFRVVSVFPRRTMESSYVTTVTVENLGRAAAEVPLTVRFDGGDATRRLLVRANDQASIRFPTPSLPTEVVVNDGSVPESDLSNNVFLVKDPQK